VKFIHAADLHIDSPLRGLDAYQGAPVERLRGASRRALIALVDLAIEQQVQFVLLAGDIYDGNWADFRTGLFFRDQMLRSQMVPLLRMQPEVALRYRRLGRGQSRHFRGPFGRRFVLARAQEPCSSRAVALTKLTRIMRPNCTG
jgi:DNA repair exonuclease SbcCD nuclease subunit